MSHIFSKLIIEDNPTYVEELEKKYNIQLPPIFKAFVQTFKFGEFNATPKHDIIHQDDKIGYDGFNDSLEAAIEVYNSQGEFYTNPKLLPVIISGFYHQGICLSLNDNNPDQILLVKDHNDITLVANHILEFTSQLKEIHWDDF